MTSGSPFATLKWRLTAAYVAILLGAISFLVFSITRWVGSFGQDQTIGKLSAESRYLARAIGSLDEKHFQEMAEQAGEALGVRVTIVDYEGAVLADNQSDPKKMENHGLRPEILQAFREGSGNSVRHSKTLGKKMVYSAARTKDGKTVVRLAVPLAEMERIESRLRRAFILLAAISTALALWLGYVTSRAISVPLGRMSAFAEDIAHGNLRGRIYIGKSTPLELARLAESLNGMAQHLQETLGQLAEEKSLAETVLWKMNDGIIVVDIEGRIRLANPAAEVILGASSEKLTGRTLIEATFNPDLSELVGRTLKSGEPSSLEVEINIPHKRNLAVYAAPIEDASSVPRRKGAVLVLHDLTRERYTDQVRRDFVANVSHELRTPLASMKAMAETICLRGKENPALAADFAEKMVAEIDRLALMTDELLDLAEIEAGRRNIRKVPLIAKSAVEDAVQSVAAMAAKKNISIYINVEPETKVLADPDGLKQILVNLLDNAVKYTEPGGSVTITADEKPFGTSISIADTGIGISSEDQKRIFERFYRVDQDRSRATGGTGLGLSIVKHLVESHEGKITVESELGSGSVFTVYFPNQN